MSSPDRYSEPDSGDAELAKMLADLENLVWESARARSLRLLTMDDRITAGQLARFMTPYTQPDESAKDQWFGMARP